VNQSRTSRSSRSPVRTHPRSGCPAARPSASRWLLLVRTWSRRRGFLVSFLTSKQNSDLRSCSRAWSRFIGAPDGSDRNAGYIAGGGLDQISEATLGSLIRLRGPSSLRSRDPKIHCLGDARGRPTAFDLTAGEAADCKSYDTLIDLPGAGARRPRRRQGL
jgi:hypothetical protein